MWPSSPPGHGRWVWRPARTADRRSLWSWPAGPTDRWPSAGDARLWAGAGFPRGSGALPGVGASFLRANRPVSYADAVAGGFNFPQNTGTLANMGWRNGVLTLTANSSLTRVEFLSTTAINGTGPALDNISLTAVPEPSVTLLALAGAAGLLALRRRRQS